MVAKQLLQSVPGSKLDSLFSGKYKLKQVDGKYYMNSDPKIFRYILQFLTNGNQIPKILNKQIRLQFDQEVRLLGLHSRSQILMDFVKIFKTKPKRFSQKQEQVWNQIGPFDIDTYIRDDKIKFDEGIDISSGTETNDENDTYDYQRQEKNGKEHGIARINFHGDGHLTECSYLNGVAHGFGRDIYQSGDYYIGQFKDHKRHGLGKIVKYDGVVQEGLWIRDVFEDDIEIQE